MTKGMQVLLVYELVPEETRLYLIPDAPKWLLDCHMGFVNGNASADVLDKIMRVSDAICDNPDHYNDPGDELAGAWVRHRLALDAPAPTVNGRLVLCGFIL